MELRGSTVAVFGLGRSGAAACRFCLARGARVVGLDDKPRGSLAGLAEELEAAGAELRLGGEGREALGASDLVVVSPGVPPFEELAAAEAAGVPVVAEVELAAWYLRAPVVGITGTNGKSTVTALVGAMLEASGRPTFAGGNLGTPLVEAVSGPADGPDGVLVVELSSYQLERVARLRPRVAVLLNVTEDHLDRYPSMAAYAAAKARILVAQGPDDHVVVDGTDALALSMARGGRGRLHAFGGPEDEVRVEGEALVDAGAPGGPRRYPLSLLKIAGAHNRMNAAAAVLAARLAGASDEGIERALGSFAGLAHRMAFVGERAGVRFYDDSKATNVGAAVAALRGLEGKAVLIAGGRDKGGSYAPLREQVVARARAVVVLGEAADLIETALAGAAPVERAGSMAEAVRRAAALARAGDAVLLAPACSSFDMYASYAERGDEFARLVGELPEET